MHLEWLQIKQVRNLTDVRIEPSSKLNIFTGRNAAGKTAVLESIYLLARARSFRTPKIQDVIQNGSTALQITAKTASKHFGVVNTGIEKSKGQTLIRHNGATVKTVSEQARNLPVVHMTPDTHLLITGSPKQRRHWLDWVMFHVEQHYLDSWRKYFRSLRHRNSLLKERVSGGEDYLYWFTALWVGGGILTQARKTTVEVLEKTVQALAKDTFQKEFTIALYPGWAEKEEFEFYLRKERGKDIAAGFSRYGPHRADIEFLVDGVPVASVFSRGQIKLFVALVMMAEAMLFSQTMGDSPLFLLDDYSAELDEEASDFLVNALFQREWQVFLTATDYRGSPPPFSEQKMFHVEHGNVTKVIE